MLKMITNQSEYLPSRGHLAGSGVQISRRGCPVKTLDEAATLTDRIDRLERRNRQLSRAVVGLVALPVALLTGAALAAPKGVVVKATQFVLEDDAGTKRGEFFVGPDGSGRFILYGRDGRPAATLPFEPQMVPLGR
jgi:hypothetical protein